MEHQNFDKLIAKRKQWVQSSKENNFDFDSILAGIYNDPSHFIYEILQNSEDAKATEITLCLFSDRLEIKHNGKEFDYNDVDGITGIGISTKKDDINSIGKFGVGFKSVFAITKAPVIHSGFFHFEIQDFVIPSIIDNNGIQETLIVLPFNHPSRTKDEVFEIVSKKLESIGLKTLLFLKNVKEIKWQTPNKTGHYYKESNEFQDLENVQRVSIISKIEQEEDFEEFLVIKKPIKIESHNLNVEIAYRIGTDEAGKEIIEKEKDSKLIVFFPTEKVTYLNFLIQAPYKTTPNRENIPLDDEQNQCLIAETANLVADSIPIVRELGFLNVPFLEVLPIDRNHTDEIIYSSIYEKVKEKLLLEEALLPTLTQNFTTAQNALLARGKELTELLDENDIKVLFGKIDWLDANITYDRTRQLRDYLINELDIQEVDFEDFAVNIKQEFIHQKSDDWLIDFYSRLLDQHSLWAKGEYSGRNAGVLREKPIIRLSENTHIAPCDRDNKIQVYLPAETKSKYKTVKEILVQNEKSLKFLTELGLSKPDIFAEIKEFVVPKYRDSDPDVDIEEYFEDFEKLLIAYQREDSEKKKEMINNFKELNIIYSTNSINGENHFCKPTETYLKTEDLIEYFKDFDHVNFVSDELNQILGNTDSVLTKLLLTIGCVDKPRRVYIEPTLSWEEKSKLRKKSNYNGFTHEIHTYDYNYEGINNFLKNTTEKRACILWNLLLKSLESYPKYSKQNFFQGEYKWKYYNESTAYFESRFLKTLKNTAWIVDSNGNFFLPSQISLSELPESYTKDDENVEVLTNALGFQIDEIKQIEEKTGGKFVSKDEYEEFLKWKKEQSEKEPEEETGDDSWISDVDPESVEPTTVEEMEPEIIKTPDLRGQRPSESSNDTHDEGSDAHDQDRLDEGRSKKQLKDIGKWGERFVYNYLKNKLRGQENIKIIWLNEGGNVGKGYDFSIVSDGKEVEYIEVKSKTDSAPQLFKITGTQWEFARKLYNDNEGDKYKIYVVSNAGNENAKIGIIKNPAKLWKEGKLYANPVYIKL